LGIIVENAFMEVVIPILMPSYSFKQQTFLVGDGILL